MDEVLKAGRQGFFAQLAIHGSEPLTEMVAICRTEAGFIVFSDRLMEGLHGRGVSRRSDHGCSHKTPTNVSLCLDRLVDAS